VVCSSQLIAEAVSQKSEPFQLIRNLEIDNFRCFKQVKLHDVRRFTIITGPNGSGKTALLEALFVGGGNTAEIYLRTNVWRGKEEFTIPMMPGQMVPLVEDYFFQFDVTQPLRVWFRDNHTGEREVRLVAARDEVLSLPLDAKASEAVSSQPSSIKFFWRTPKGELEAQPEVTAAGLRLARPEDVYFMVFLNTLTVGSAKEIAGRYSTLSSKNQEGPIVKAVQSIFDYVQGLTVLSPGGSPAIHAVVRGLDRKIPLGLLSAGINKFVAILGAICSAPNGAVLIDEVENGWYHKVCPQMWKAIVDLAEETHTQIFATTHSKEFLESIAPAVTADQRNYCLLRTERRNGESTVTAFSGEELARAIEQGFEVR